MGARIAAFPGAAWNAPWRASYVRTYSDTVYHPSATCRMGAPEDPDAVVDPRLRVRGVQGLRVADASVFPELVRVNPNMTVVMVGAKAADLIAEDHSVSD